MRSEWIRWLAASGVVGGLVLLGSACVHAPPEEATVQARVAAPVARAPDPAIDLLNFAHRLSQATPQQRAEAVVATRQAVRDDPNARSYANLAIAYGAPSQRRYTPDEAARYARRAVQAEDADWSPAARQYLSDYARLRAPTTRSGSPSHPVDSSAAVRRGYDTDRPDTTPAADDRGQSADRDAEVMRLQAELDDAHRKLRELANIENRLGDSPQ